MSLEVAAVAGGRDLKAFIDLPFRLHAGTPWIPPLKVERRLFLGRRTNPFFKHGEAQYFLARRGGRVVGRVSAHVDHAFNDFHRNAWGMFGFLEFEDDPDVVRALLDTAAAWLRERGRERMVGPMDFSMNDEAGVLIEGFEREPMIRQPWHPPYYRERIEEAGLDKAVDLLMWERWLDDPETPMMSLMFELAEKARSEHGITVRKMSRLHLRKELDLFAEVYNSAWCDNWGFVPYSKEDLDAYALDLHLVYDRDWFMVAEKDGEVVAVAITIPDINQVLRRMRGRVLPFGWWSFVAKRRVVKRLRVGFLGVKPEYQHTGVAAALYVGHFEAARHSRIKGGEMGWILETNTAMNRGMEMMGARIVKRYRVYEQQL